jgi:hypothetical protein
MTIIEFAPKGDRAADGWRNCELDRLTQAFAAEFDRGHIDGWATGSTETGDPQFYVIGPQPEHDCLLCVSRLDTLYLLEDGEGHLVYENADFGLLLRQATTWFKTSKARLLAQVLLAWVAVRHAVQEKIEPVLIEGEEMLVHVAPQLAAIA